MTEATFQAPKRRVRVYESYEAPFPVPVCAGEAQDYGTYKAEIVNLHVIVRDPGHVEALYGKGYFGKGILSRSRPQYSISKKKQKLDTGCLPVVSFAKYQQHVSWARDALLAQGLGEEEVNQTLQKFVNPEVTGFQEDNGLGAGTRGPDRRGETEATPILFPGCLHQECSKCDRPRGERDSEEPMDCDHPQHDPLTGLFPQEPEPVDGCGCQLSDSLPMTLGPMRAGKQGPTPSLGYEYLLVEEQEEGECVGDTHNNHSCGMRLVCRINPFRIIEYLQLSLEEAFFLVYALGCLSVYSDEEPLTIAELWEMFRAAQPNFETTYMAYHYFRSKGWVPKVGVKYGTDLLLYRKGPPFYHASYSVVVERVDDSFRGATLRPFTWRSLAALSRITGNVSKELMLCYVIRPSDMSEDELSSPECMKRIKVQEIIVSRWISSRERTEQEDI